MKKVNTMKNAIVTGGSRGLGRAIAIQLAQEGYHVGIGYFKNDHKAQEVLTLIKEQGYSASLLKLDIRDSDNVDSIINNFIGEFGTTEILVNNAGITRDNSFVFLSSEDWKNVVDTNLGGTFNCSKAIVKSMISNKKGVIVNIGSISGVVASPGQSNYSASKGGIIALTRTMARELSPYGIRVNSVIPGLLSDGMSRKLERKYISQYKERIPINRLGNTNEVANVVSFLCSEKASYIIGQNIIVDGGLTL